MTLQTVIPNRSLAPVRFADALKDVRGCMFTLIPRLDRAADAVRLVTGDADTAINRPDNAAVAENRVTGLAAIAMFFPVNTAAAENLVTELAVMAIFLLDTVAIAVNEVTGLAVMSMVLLEGYDAGTCGDVDGVMLRQRPGTIDGTGDKQVAGNSVIPNPVMGESDRREGGNVGTNGNQ